jgi:hypothetical protein
LQRAKKSATTAFLAAASIEAKVPCAMIPAQADVSVQRARGESRTILG